MSAHTAHPATLSLNDRSWFVWLTAVLLASIVLTVSAKLKVPFYPVPMTMQPLAVIGIGLLLGSRLGIAAVLAYLAQGAAGLPVFTGTPEKGLGVAYMMGPTGGFLLGFLIAVAVVGYAADRGWTRSIVGALAVAVAGVGLIYAPGVAYLSSLIGFEKAMTFGVMPFWLKDLVAAAIAALVAVATVRASHR